MARAGEPPPGFGGPAGMGPAAPRPADVRREADRSRSPLSSPARARATVPQPFNFGPRRRRSGGGAPQPIDDRTFGEVVKAPPGFKVTLFAAPPQVNYPGGARRRRPDGEVYVAVDEQGSLGRTPGGGRIMRCVDEDGDGKADRVTVFAKVEHPRGVIATRTARSGSCTRRSLSVFHDDNGDGVSDRQDVLVTGLTTEPDRRARRRPHDQRHPHGDRRLDLHRRRRLRLQRGQGEGRHDARRNAAAASSASGPTAPSWRSRHRPAQPVRPRHRPVPEPLHPRQHQRRRRLGHAGQPPDADGRLRLHADCSPTSPTRPCRRSARSAAGAARADCSLQDAALARAVPRRAVHGRLGPQRGLPPRAEGPQRPRSTCGQEVFLKHPAADGHGHRPRRPAVRRELARRRGERLRRPERRVRRVRRRRRD